MSYLKNEHRFSRMSHVLGGEMFKDEQEPIEFKVGKCSKFFNLLHEL